MLGSKKGWNKFNGRTQFIFNWIKFSGKNIIRGNLLRSAKEHQMSGIESYKENVFVFISDRGEGGGEGDYEHQTRK